MDLILWRHAQAVTLGGESADDLQRELTTKGRQDARRMARWLVQRLPQSARIIVSPALRCQQTAEALGLRFTTVDEIAPECTVDQLFDAVGWPEAKQATLIVGHQPTLGLVASRLLANELRPWHIKKAGVWWFKGEPGDDVVQVDIKSGNFTERLLRVPSTEF